MRPFHGERLLSLFLLFVIWQSRVLLAEPTTVDVTTQIFNEDTKPAENPHSTEAQSTWTSDDQSEDESESDATVCEFENDHSISNDYNSVMMVNFNVIVDLHYRATRKGRTSLEQMKTLERNRICNHLIKVAKVVQAKHFDETVWCKDDYLFSAEPLALSNLSVYIPIQSPIHGFPRGCANLLQDSYQSLLDRHVSYAFSRSPQTSRITVDEKLYQVHLTIATVELMEKENVIMQDPWLPKWDDTARTLVFEWLRDTDSMKSLLSLAIDHQASSTSGLYNLQLVWLVSEADSDEFRKDDFVKKSLSEYFREKKFKIYLGNIKFTTRSDSSSELQNDAAGDMFGSIKSQFKQNSNPPLESCPCSTLESMNTLLITIEADMGVSTNGRSSETHLDEHVAKALAAIDANDILPIRRVHTDVTFNEKEGLKSYRMTLSFDIGENPVDGDLVRHTLDQVKQHVDVTKYLTGERLNGKMRWKAATTQCYYSAKPRPYLEWTMNVHVISTLDALEKIAENLGLQLSHIFEKEGLNKHIISRSFVRSSRFGNKTRFAMQIVLNLYSLIEEQPKLAEQITGKLSAISSRLQESMKNHSDSFRISPELRWVLKEQLCLDARHSHVDE